MKATLTPRQGPTFNVDLNVVGQLPDILIVDNRYYVCSESGGLHGARRLPNIHFREATMMMLHNKPPQMRGGKGIPVIAKGDPDDRE